MAQIWTLTEINPILVNNTDIVLLYIYTKQLLQWSNRTWRWVLLHVLYNAYLIQYYLVQYHTIPYNTRYYQTLQYIIINYITTTQHTSTLLAMEKWIQKTSLLKDWPFILPLIGFGRHKNCTPFIASIFPNKSSNPIFLDFPLGRTT
jgi:hypothetical protein